jgi:hypothetical protein
MPVFEPGVCRRQTPGPKTATEGGKEAAVTNAPGKAGRVEFAIGKLQALQPPRRAVVRQINQKEMEKGNE